MSSRGPADTAFALRELDVLDRDGPVCGRIRHSGDHRYRRFQTPDGPVRLIGTLKHCPDPAGPGHARAQSPDLEITLALPPMALGWDVLCGIGPRRGARHIANALIRSELLDGDGIKRSEDALGQSIRRYQVRRAARPHDAESLRRCDESVAESILGIDGLPPEKGHEALDVVRELTRKRARFAEPLLPATADEVRRLIRKAKEWPQSVGASVGLGMSDEQEAFVTAIAVGFPDGPHRDWDHHVLRDLARPVREADSHATVPMRKGGRGPRTIGRAVLQRPEAAATEALTPRARQATGLATAADRSAAVVDPAGSVVLA